MTKRWFARGASVLALLALLPGARAEDRVKVVLPAWGLTLSDDGNGLFNKLFNFVLRADKDQLDIRYVPYETAIRLLANKNTDCIYPINIGTLVSTDKHINPVSLVESQPALISKSYVFSRPHEPVLSSFEELRGKMLIQIKGENYNHNEFTAGASFLNVGDETEKVRILLSGRGHAMLASMPDILYSMWQLKVDHLPYDPAFTVLDYKNSLTCIWKHKTNALVALFDTRLRTALEDGSLRDLVVSEGVPVEMVDDFLPQLP